MEKISIGVTFKNVKVLNNKKRDWWIWSIGALIMAAGVALVGICIWLLVDSYLRGSPQAAFAGGIASGIGLLFAGVCQLIVFIYRKRDAKEKKYFNVEHDFSNFFIKNLDYNETVLIVLNRAFNSCKIKLEYNESKITLSYDIQKTNATIKDLCSKYIYELVYGIVSKSDFVEPLTRKYSIQAKNNVNRYYDGILSCFDTEVKKTIYSLEKMLQRKYFEFYDNNFFAFNMENTVNKYINVILAYLLIVIYGSDLYGDFNELVELIPFTLYYYSKLGEKQ